MSTISPPPVHRIGLSSAGISLSPDEFDAIEDYDDQFRYELVHGVLVVHSIPSEGEAGPNEELGFLLRLYRDQHPQGAALNATLPERYVRLVDSRRRADRVIWAGLGRMPDPAVDVPTIVVEFVSAGRRDWRRDYIEKRQEYLALGVREYWVIDRFDRKMTVYRPPVDAKNETVVGEGDVYRSKILPGFELPLARLLAAADAWRDAQ
ncbi:MAG: Uma2 family endonuclease [Pirellulales bacterium]